MAIPVYRQKTSIEGLIVGVAAAQTCPKCGQTYSDLRVEPVSVSRSGVPAPFMAPSWGESKRRTEVSAELAARVQDRETYGIAPMFGAIRCPACRRGLRRQADPSYIKTEVWLAIGLILGLIVAYGAFQIAMGATTGTHAQAEDAGVKAGFFAFLATFAVAAVFAVLRHRAAVAAMDQPSKTSPVNAATN